MSSSVYIETSIISYLTARPSRDLAIAGLEEIRQIRDHYVSQFNYDLQAINDVWITLSIV
ncbi:hypothetical protein PN462_15640 [Spirulina sp. CS-785/01]|uniref:hypothetical protein n=1 Tax=Spirulina sp. CS-785/01 TaxID=3021716 RepID=UPI00232E663E|nr:hypothetical protein [Spirulina sp. CS-785/01]MDB9314543.1 hypothetical protein [Spirulina sp. CS-785/01]